MPSLSSHALVTATLVAELGTSKQAARALAAELRLLVADVDDRRWLIFALRTWRAAVAPYQHSAEPDVNIQHLARSAAHFPTGYDEEPLPVGH